MSMIHCRHFNGYKPCGKSELCDEACESLNIPATRVLVIHLEALGAVLRSTALLAPIKRKYPFAHITWVTQKPAEQLLLHNPLIDKVIGFEAANLLGLTSLQFDVTFCIDKSFQATGLAAHIQTELLYGFELNKQTGAIVPVTAAANELWSLGLSNKKKFFENEKSETQLICEALELGPFQRDAYILKLSPEEKSEALLRKRTWSQNAKLVIGINTGCSNVITYKKLSVKAHRDLIAKISKNSDFQIVLLGGKEDSARNLEIGHALNVIQSSTEKGLRDGIVSCEACDIIVSGDSLGMHIGIALKKYMIAWFGPTCAQEIDLYENGVKVLSEAPCGPCWKRDCQQPTMCYDLVDLDQIYAGILLGQKRILRNHGSKDINHSDSIHW